MREFVLCDMTADGLSAYVARQLGTFFPDERPPSGGSGAAYMKDALARTHLCFSGIEKRNSATASG